MDKEICYICDRRVAKCRRHCLWLRVIGRAVCTHTLDPAHAKHGACENPEADPLRFHRVEKPGGGVFYYERPRERTGMWARGMVALRKMIKNYLITFTR